MMSLTQQKEFKGYDIYRWNPEFEAFDDEFIEDLDVSMIESYQDKWLHIKSKRRC